MAELKFKFQNVLNEIHAFESIAAKFIDPSARDVLPQARHFLESYRDQNTTTPVDLQIRRENPFKTIASNGSYEVGSGGYHKVHAEISSKWRIQRIRPKKGRAQEFKLIGLASTKIRLVCTRTNAEQEIAMWKMEVGDSQSPGCFFHAQILGDTNNPPFPSSLSIPRFPALMLTPVAIAEFVLAELFQEDWASHLAGQPAELNRWVPIQQERFRSLLKWKLDVVESGGSPWTTIKQRKPAADLFL